MTVGVSLRDVVEDDLPIFFEHECDADAIYMAAFTPKDPTNGEVFAAHWSRIMADQTVLIRTIVCDGSVAGSVLSYEKSGKPEVTCWIGKGYWGQGIASRALRAFLDHADTRRPMRARVAKDSVRSTRVLERCGFQATGEARGFANARGTEIDELVFELTAASTRGVP